MSNPLERDQQTQEKDGLIAHSSIETHSEAEGARQDARSSGNVVAREAFFKQFEAVEDKKKPADYNALLDKAQLEEDKTIDLTESLQQAKTQSAPEQPLEIKESTAKQSRAERRKKLKEEKRMNQNKSAEKEQATSREAMRKKEQEATKKLRVRFFPIWLRLVIVLVLCVAALVGGTMLGYGIIGKGNPMDVFDVKTWTHIRDIIYLKK
ncbi:MAG TPA: DNA-directed RNA polymerase subunit beta [Candidatus Angelobacter sp.]|nr:DNA-directed RNA polymerase subunit beta [Candidatus Angelobacter sp.]